MKLTKKEKDRLIYLLENEKELLLKRHATQSSVGEVDRLIKKIKKL